MKNSFAFLRILKTKSLIKPRDETQGKEGRENVKIPMTRIIKGEISVGEGMGNYRVIFLWKEGSTSWRNVLRVSRYVNRILVFREIDWQGRGCEGKEGKMK